MGQQLASAVDDTTGLAVRWQGDGRTLTCGGHMTVDPSGPDAVVAKQELDRTT